MNIFVCTPTEFLDASPPERRKLVLAQIEATPELHDQDSWAVRTNCGTVCCAAGWTVTLAGGSFVWGEAATEDPHLAAYVEFAGVRHPIETLAADLLGLDDGECERVFFDANDAEEVRDALEAVR